jgi:hypothetical protein
MTTVNTNVQPTTKSFGTDWSTVWSTVQAADHVITKRLWLGVIILSVAYIVGCILHATGYGVINIVICTIAILMVAVNAARPVMLFIFGLGGAVYAWTDKVVDTGPGVKAGLVNLGRLANAVMLFIGLTFFLLGTWPFSVPNWMYAILPAGTALIVNILIYEKMASKGWVWLLGGSYVITILLYGAFSEVPIVKAVVGWADAKQEDAAKAINESADLKVPLSTEDQAERLAREAQDAEAAAARMKIQAAADAEAAEAARLATVATINLPTSVRVPKCGKGMSQEIDIPVGWSLTSGWGGGRLKIEYLNDGEWKKAEHANLTGSVEAFRYCTTSDAYAKKGEMQLVWRKL